MLLENQEKDAAMLRFNESIRTIETVFNPVAGIYLEFVAKCAVSEKSGIGIIVGPIEKPRLDAIKEALTAIPNLPEQLGVTHIRVDDKDMSLRAIVASKYREIRCCRLHTAAPIAFTTMMTAANDAKRANTTIAVLAGVAETVHLQIEEILKYEKDVDIVFGVVSFAFHEDIECVPSTRVDYVLTQLATDAEVLAAAEQEVRAAAE